MTTGDRRGATAASTSCSFAATGLLYKTRAYMSCHLPAPLLVHLGCKFSKHTNICNLEHEACKGAVAGYVGPAQEAHAAAQSTASLLAKGRN